MKYKSLFALTLTVLLFISHVCAQEDIVILQTPGSFTPQKDSFEVQSDGRVLMCGSTGNVMDSHAAISMFDVDGNVIDMTPPNDTLEGMYRDAFMIDDNNMIALRSVPNEYTWRIAHLENGEIKWTSKKTENVFDLERVDNRFLVYCKPEPVTAEIWCMDFDGNVDWKIRLEERIILEGILVGNGIHIAYGSKMEDPIGDKDQRSVSLVFAFDDEGKILWRHDGSRLGYSTAYIDAVWVDDEVIVIGVDRVCRYNKDGLLWEKEYTDSGMTGIEPIENGYLVSYHKHARKGMSFIKIDKDGELTGEFYLHDVPGGTNKLLIIDTAPYMVFYNSIMAEPVELIKIDVEKYLN